jgi:predicted DNA-binding transcriptional regulator YafY
MKMQTAARLLEILSVPVEEAMTTQEIGLKWYRNAKPDRKSSRDKPTQLTADELRSIQRYVKELRTPTKDHPALIETVEIKRADSEHVEYRYYHKHSRVVQWLMTDEAALNILLAKQIQSRAFGPIIDSKDISAIAETVASASSKTQRIRDKLRVVPDGVGRLPATISADILQATFDAIAQERQLRIAYVHSQGEPSEHLVSPQGLIAKDGTVYLLATKGLSDSPGRPFALHRVKTAEVTHKKVQARPDFDLDRYISDSHQLSHRLDEHAPDIQLELWVAPETLYHFKERPLSNDQEIGANRKSDKWRAVTATVPHTILLVPFLLSMGGWIEVVAPTEVRTEMVVRIQKMAEHYKE